MIKLQYSKNIDQDIEKLKQINYKIVATTEPRNEKTINLHKRKQRRRSASQ